MTALKFLAVWVGLIVVCWAVVLLPAWLLLEHPAWLVYAVAAAGIVAAGVWSLRMVPRRREPQECSHYKVGIRASALGRYAEQAEDLADRIGAMDAEAANLIYRASSVLRAAAVEASAP